jgi:hypothetical protein
MFNISGGMVQQTVSSLTHIVNTYDTAPSPIIKQIRVMVIKYHNDEMTGDVIISQLFIANKELIDN